MLNASAIASFGRLPANNSILGIVAGFSSLLLAYWLLAGRYPPLSPPLCPGRYRDHAAYVHCGKWTGGLPAGLKQILCSGVSKFTSRFTPGVSAFMARSRRKPALPQFYATAINAGRPALSVRTEMVYASWHFHLMAVYGGIGWNRVCSQIGFIPNQTGTGLENEVYRAAAGKFQTSARGTVIVALFSALFSYANR